MFLPYSNDHGAVAPWEYLSAAAGTYQAGQALNVSGGKLAAISAASTAKPAYICMASATVADGDNLPVIRVQNDTIYETTLSAAASSAAVGTKLQIAAGGLQANGAAAGAFEVVYLDGTAVDSIVRGRFV